MFRTALIALPLVFGLAGPVAADDDGKSLERDMQRMEEIARQAAEQLIGSLQAMIGAVPQFEAPEILENGDIIIRRKDKDATPPAPKQREPRRRPGDNDPRHGSTDI